MPVHHHRSGLTSEGSQEMRILHPESLGPCHLKLIVFPGWMHAHPRIGMGPSPMRPVWSFQSWRDCTICGSQHQLLAEECSGSEAALSLLYLTSRVLHTQESSWVSAQASDTSLGSCLGLWKVLSSLVLLSSQNHLEQDSGRHSPR